MSTGARRFVRPSHPARRLAWSHAAGVMAATVGLWEGLPARADEPLPLPAAVADATKNDIMPALEAAGVKAVGVLKFRVIGPQSSMADASASLGAINTDLAAQFETAILLNVSRRRPVDVLRNPSAVAATIADASHLTAEGQKLLFDAEYPVVVGPPEKRVRPDALLFGIGQVSKDAGRIRVAVAMIRRDDATPAKVCEFDARLGAENLVAVGESFLATRGLFPTGAGAEAKQAAAERPEKLASLAKDVRDGSRPFPLLDPESPVRLRIRYDGVEQKIESRDGGGFVVEPRKGQKITFSIEKARRDARRFAVALKVNGENTARRDVRPDLSAAKWVLSDDFPVIPVKGYAVDATTIQPFLVLSDEESVNRALDYGIDAGTITMTVFAEQPAATPSDLPPDELPPDESDQLTTNGPVPLDIALLSGGVRLDPTQSFASLDEAKGALQSRAKARDRGIIVPNSATEQSAQKKVEFVEIIDPVMSVVVRYYTPR